MARRNLGKPGMKCWRPISNTELYKGCDRRPRYVVHCHTQEGLPTTAWKHGWLHCGQNRCGDGNGGIWPFGKCHGQWSQCNIQQFGDIMHCESVAREWWDSWRKPCCTHFYRQRFSGRQWIVKWYWKEGSPVLRNAVGCYQHTRSVFKGEVEVVSGVLPLMVVVQPTKHKVRLVIFWELNDHVSYHMGSRAMDVCGKTQIEWWQIIGASTINNLKLAYLQLHVAEKLWKYIIHTGYMSSCFLLLSHCFRWCTLQPSLGVLVQFQT